MIDQLFNNPAVSVLERTLNFTGQRHQLILDNIANASTPGYVQQDVSTDEFQNSLRKALDGRRNGYLDPLRPESTRTVTFDRDSNAVGLKPRAVIAETPFHDRGVRSMESMMSDLADNAQVHNIAVQLLKNRYTMLASAISMRA